MVTVAEIQAWRQLCWPCAHEYHRWATHKFPPIRGYISLTERLTRDNYRGLKTDQDGLRRQALRDIKNRCPGVSHARGPAGRKYDYLRGCPTIRSFWDKGEKSECFEESVSGF